MSNIKPLHILVREQRIDTGANPRGDNLLIYDPVKVFSSEDRRHIWILDFFNRDFFYRSSVLHTDLTPEELLYRFQEIYPRKIGECSGLLGAFSVTRINSNSVDDLLIAIDRNSLSFQRE